VLPSISGKRKVTVPAGRSDIVLPSRHSLQYSPSNCQILGCVRRCVQRDVVTILDGDFTVNIGKKCTIADIWKSVAKIAGIAGDVEAGAEVQVGQDTVPYLILSIM
jgi:hypothetical protein